MGIVMELFVKVPMEQIMVVIILLADIIIFVYFMASFIFSLIIICEKIDSAFELR